MKLLWQHGHPSNWPVGVEWKVSISLLLPEMLRNYFEGSMKFTRLQKNKKMLSVMFFIFIFGVSFQGLRIHWLMSNGWIVIPLEKINFAWATGLCLDPCLVETGMWEELWYTTDTQSVSHISDTPVMTFVFLYSYCYFCLFWLKRMMVIIFRKGGCFLCALLELLSLFYQLKPEL